MRISIDFFGGTELEVSDVWPDGDAPEQITAEAVKAVMEDSGGKRSVLPDWNLLDFLEVTVTVDGNEADVWDGIR